MKSYLFMIGKAACVAHSAKAWIIILAVNNDKDFLYIHPAWKQHASTNMPSLIMHHLLWTLTNQYPLLAGFWQVSKMLTFTTAHPTSSLFLWDKNGASRKAPYETKSTNIVLTTGKSVNKWHYQLRGDIQLNLAWGQFISQTNFLTGLYNYRV